MTQTYQVTPSSPAGEAGVPASPFPGRSSCKDAAVSFTGHGHRLASLFRGAKEPHISFIDLKICKKLRPAARAACAYLETNEEGDVPR